jgi:hypothetical protein
VVDYQWYSFLQVYMHLLVVVCQNQDLQDFRIYMMWADWVLWFCSHIGFVFNFQFCRFFAGCFMGFGA